MALAKIGARWQQRWRVAAWRWHRRQISEITAPRLISACSANVAAWRQAQLASLTKCSSKCMRLAYSFALWRVLGWQQLANSGETAAALAAAALALSAAARNGVKRRRGWQWRHGGSALAGQSGQQSANVWRNNVCSAASEWQRNSNSLAVANQWRLAWHRLALAHGSASAGGAAWLAAAWRGAAGGRRGVLGGVAIKLGGFSIWQLLSWLAAASRGGSLAQPRRAAGGSGMQRQPGIGGIMLWPASWLAAACV